MNKFLFLALLVTSCSDPMPPGKVGHMIMQLPDTVHGSAANKHGEDGLNDSCDRAAADSIWGVMGRKGIAYDTCPLRIDSAFLREHDSTVAKEGGGL